jgi:hypothetical protein
MRFFLVHELSCSNGAGRLRARACRPMTQAQAEILADTLDAIDLSSVQAPEHYQKELKRLQKEIYQLSYPACAGPAGRAPLPGRPGRGRPQ